jgi:integrase/recombinase XerC
MPRSVSYISPLMGGKTLRALTFAYVSERRATGRIARSTATNEAYVLRGFADVAGNRKPSQLGRKDVERWLSETQHLAASTRATEWRVIRGFLDWLVETRRLARNPMRKIPPPKATKKAKRALSGQDAANVLAACPDQRARVIVVLGLQMGLRRGEISRLRVECVDFRRRAATVLGKGGHERVVPLTSAAVAEIKALLRQEPATAGPLIRKQQGKGGVTPQRVYQIVAKACVDAGVKVHPFDGVSTHALRHTAATDVYASCRDIRAVQAMLGHSSLATTDRYIRGLDLSSLSEAMDGRWYGEAS